MAARFITFTTVDGTVCDGILLSPTTDTGEGASKALVIPLDRGDGVGIPIEAVQGADADSYSEA